MSDYTFSNFRDFFEYHLQKCARNNEGVKVLTLNDLSKKLGYNSPSLLSMIANGKRLPSNEILEALFDEWKIEGTQREIVRVRLEIEKKIRKNRPAHNLIDKLTRLDKKSRFARIDLDTFRAIKEWYIIVLRQMVSAPDFCEDYTLISQRLRKKVTPAQIRKGIETLIKTGLLKREPKNKELVLRLDGPVETDHEVPSEAVREHHRGMILRALESIDEQSIEERHLNSLTLRFAPDKRPMAKAAILNFVKEFNDQFYDEQAQNIFQLNVQLFEHTTLFSSPEKKEILQ